MREAVGVQRTGAAWLLKFSIVASLASACAEMGAQPDVPGDDATGTDAGAAAPRRDAGPDTSEQPEASEDTDTSTPPRAGPTRNAADAGPQTAGHEGDASTKADAGAPSA